jgi:hypothetical protein
VITSRRMSWVAYVESMGEAGNAKCSSYKETVRMEATYKN